MGALARRDVEAIRRSRPFTSASRCGRISQTRARTSSCLGGAATTTAL